MNSDDVCARLGLIPQMPDPHTKIGVSVSALHGEWPLNGLRHQPEGDTNGWYIWSGEFSDAADFFLPLHTKHVDERIPAILPYLALPPGWRFLLAPGYEDIWEDRSLLGR